MHLEASVTGLEPYVLGSREDRMRRIVALTLMLVASIAGIALAQSHHHDDANSGRTNSADASFALQMMGDGADGFEHDGRKANR